MAVSLTLTGSADLGDIRTWSVEEQATPVAPGDTSGSVGQVSLSAERLDDSEFVINSESVFSHDTLGDVYGSVDTFSTVGTQGGDAEITTTTPL